MSLRDELKGIAGKRRRYLLIRIAGMDDVQMALSTLGVTRHAYNGWLGDDSFKELHRRLPELKKDYREEALKAIRQDNQFSATLLEQEIIDKLREEIASGDLAIARTHLGREVYSKLMSELEKTPHIQVSQSWEQRVLQLTNRERLGSGEEIDGDYTTESSPQEEHQESSDGEEDTRQLTQKNQ